MRNKRELSLTGEIRRAQALSEDLDNKNDIFKEHSNKALKFKVLELMRVYYTLISSNV